MREVEKDGEEVMALDRLDLPYRVNVITVNGKITAIDGINFGIY